MDNGRERNKVFTWGIAEGNLGEVTEVRFNVDCQWRATSVGDMNVEVFFYEVRLSNSRTVFDSGSHPVLELRGIEASCQSVSLNLTAPVQLVPATGNCLAGACRILVLA